jgi:hypothetical protein
LAAARDRNWEDIEKAAIATWRHRYSDGKSSSVDPARRGISPRAFIAAQNCCRD